jgi:hypothetical protein
MLILTDARGQIVGAAHIGEPAEGDIESGITPRPGQRLHETKVPPANREPGARPSATDGPCASARG